MKFKLKSTRLIKDIIGVSLVAVMLIILMLFMRNSNIVFASENHIEVNSVVDYTQFIDKMKTGKVEDVKIDSSQVNVSQLGEYEVIYHYKDEEEIFKVKVVDTVAPEFEVVNQTVALDQEIDPQSLVKNIKDATKTTITLNKTSFSNEGEREVTVTVSDEADNKTTKTVKVTVKKDKTAPHLTVSNETFVVGEKIDLKKLAKITDDMDKNPTLTIKNEKLDVNKIGSYPIEYIGKDASGNETKKTITIQIVEKTDKNEKIVYLTFDDGPSKHTQGVLDVLAKYDCKATFFITGMNSSYRKYIKIASDQGHTIGLHTYSHNYSKVYSSVDAYFEDLTKVGSLAKDYLGYVPKYIRFPGGSSNAVSKKYTKGIMTQLTKMVEEKGYIYYDWNAENGDGFNGLSQSEMLKRATSSKANQIMILMHDANGKQDTVDILPKVIEYYQNKGYKFKAINDSSIVPHQHVNN